MDYLANTADIKKLEQVFNYFPLTGVTTNSTIIKNSGMKLTEAVNAIRICKDMGINVIATALFTQQQALQDQYAHVSFRNNK